MDDFERRVFLAEIRHQCEFALAAYNEFVRGGNVQPVFYHIQSFLVSSFLVSGANVSKILFPGQIRGSADFKERCRQRGDELRTLLGVPDDSALSNRILRDHFEHFDERLQTWADRPGPKNFFDNFVFVGATFEQALHAPSLPPEDFFRFYATPPPTVRFWGVDYPLEPVAQAMHDLLQKIPGT